METVSLIGVASYLPERVVENDFFAEGTAQRKGMFKAPRTRRHVAPDESAADMIEQAARRLINELSLNPEGDIDLLFTNVVLPDEAFTGCGAEVARRLRCVPRYVVDLHNSGCVSFIYMLELARQLMQSGAGRSALLCAVQNAAGRVFSHPKLRLTSPAPVPGDGCGVGYVKLGKESPVLSVLHLCQPEFATDLAAVAEDGRRYWQPGSSPISLGFTEARVASIIHRGNHIVPEMVRAACDQAGISTAEIGLLVTNQPNAMFVRNWSEALELAPGVLHDTFLKYGNLFGAAIPINIGDALEQGKLSAGQYLALGGFSHAGDYAAAAVVHWKPGALGGGVSSAQQMS
jgi:3-oxoacyl-[acyl-carrier-protein] synthase III